MSLFEQGTAMELHGLSLEVAALSEQGPRSENQDAYLVDTFTSAGLLAVADGMGGERSGRAAADTALQALARSAPIRSLDHARRAVREADAEVVRAAEENPGERGGMGCALGLLALTAPRGDGVGWIAAHVGDVRIISRAPDGTVRVETRDHTPAFARWEAGEIALDEIPDSTGANRLQRAIGRGGEADVAWLPARPGWSWLIVSDGIYKALRLEELGAMMGMAGGATAACETIRRKVEERGPDDNYTAVLVRALGGPAGAPSTRDQTEPMIQPPAPPAGRPPRSGAAIAALVLALLALAAAGYALWTALESRSAAPARAEVDSLRVEVDSLRAQLRELADPFEPAPGDTAAATRMQSGAPR